MTTTSIRRLGLLAVALCAGLSAPASAQVSTTANGPYLAMPAWSQKLTTNRFVILANWNGEAVLDRETGLVWERTPEATPRSWLSANGHCIRRAAGGRKGWRLPGIQELGSLVDPTVGAPEPALPVGHPFQAVDPDLTYWSATSNSFGDDMIWIFSLGSGTPGVISKSASAAFAAWCVRGGSAPDVQ
ncbi:MAG: DUF1566 domain-containing protein [Rubrivivax sp.]|nr:DUF1566 domain-containing protein [Rubrivivax sp.]